MRPAKKRGEHLPRLVRIIVDRLLAQDDEIRPFRLAYRFQKLGDAERLHLVVGLDKEPAISAHGERLADLVLRFLRTDRDGDHLGRDLRLKKAHGLLDGDLVERVHRHFHIGEIDARLVGLHADLDVVIDDALHRHEDFHRRDPWKFNGLGEKRLRNRGGP